MKRFVSLLFFLISLSESPSHGRMLRCSHVSKPDLEDDPIGVCDHVEGYPCVCEGRTVNCNNEELETTFLDLVDEVSQVKVHELWLQGNKLTSLWANAIMPSQVGTITRLHLGHNFICYIQDGAFGGLNRLQDLDLSYNKIQHITLETFAFLPNLVMLDLKNNKISNLTGAVFAELRSLKYLYLDDNPIGIIDEETFSDLENLVELTMDNTGLSAVQKSWFRNLPSLKTLSLRKNKFMIAPQIHAIPSLEILDISSNPIYELNNNAFHGTPHLKEIVMAKMPLLWAIEDCAFCGLIYLQHIQIYNCPKLYYIDPEAFGPKHYFKKGLAVVDLSTNNLTSLARSVLPWRNVSSLKLSGNPWYCDCQISWMNDITLRYQEGLPTCNAPAALKGRHLDTVNDKEFNCADSRRSAAGKVFVAITIVLLIAGTVTLAWYLFLTRKHGPKLRNIFKRDPTQPKYAYRNLAMNAEKDESNYYTDNNSIDNKGNDNLPTPVEL